MKVQIIQQYLRREANKIRNKKDPELELAASLEWLANSVPEWAGKTLPPHTGDCPECEASCSFVMIQQFCTQDENYLAGYRGVFKCENCGEMEVR